MSAANCNAFREQLDQWMEGEPSPAAEAHIRSCADCTNLIADLDSIRDTASSLAADDPEPSARVWTALRAQLEDEGLIHAAPGSSRRETLAPGNFLGAAASRAGRRLSCGAHCGGIRALRIEQSAERQRHSGCRRTQHSRSRSARALRCRARHDFLMSSSKPAVTTSLSKNLAIVDNNITLCEKSVREHPKTRWLANIFIKRISKRPT